MTLADDKSKLLLSVAGVAAGLVPPVCRISEMSKSEELLALRALVAQLPDGYVRDILTEAEPFIEDAMRSDLAGHQPVSGLLDSKRELVKEIAECQRALADLTREIAEKNREVNRLDARMQEAKTEVRVLARAAGVL